MIFHELYILWRDVCSNFYFLEIINAFCMLPLGVPSFSLSFEKRAYANKTIFVVLI